MTAVQILDAMEFFATVQPPNQISPFDAGAEIERREERKLSALSRPTSDLTPVANPYRVGMAQPDEPVAVSGVIGASVFPANRNRHLKDGRLFNGTVQTQQMTEGFWSAYGRASGTSAGLVDSSLSQNHGSLSVISRPGASSSFVF